MLYQPIPMGEIWADGMIAVPKKIATNYLKFTSEYQLKALLIILSKNAGVTEAEIAKALGCTQEDAKEFLEFWVEEGILSCDGEVVQKQQSVPEKKEEKKPKKESVPVPRLSPRDIVCICRENRELTQCLRHSQEVLGKTLSHIEQELIVNMVTYYGLPCDVVLTILQFYKKEKESGKAIGTAYISAMAKDWSEQGIVTLADADEKLKALESSNRLWKEIVAISGIRHRSPTVKQREMIERWAEDFGIEMISIACDIMKENTDKPNLKYVDGVLKNWKKKGIFTPEDVANEEKAHNDKKQGGSSDIDETYDIDEINRRAIMNDDFDI